MVCAMSCLLVDFLFYCQMLVRCFVICFCSAVVLSADSREADSLWRSLAQADSLCVDERSDLLFES
jgi:hypothetical protein